MTLFVANGKIVYFTHIPKTGGSSIEDGLEAAGVRRAMLQASTKGFMKCTPQHMHADIIKHFYPNNFFDYIFTVCRHPVTRMVSEYKMRMANRNERMSFQEFVDHALKKYEDNPYSLDNHIRRQSEFITESTKIFRFEEGLRPVFDAFCTTTGIPHITEIPHSRKGSPDAVDIPPETLDKILDFYAEDFIAFGYEATAPSHV